VDYEDIILDKRRDNIAVITLNRPERLNAVTWQSWSQVEDAFERLSVDDDVRVIVLTGAGRGFCSGTDLAAASALPGESSRSRRMRSPYDTVNKLLACPKPSIGAINGVAAGAGLSLAVGCDMRIAGEGARFSAIWARRALVPDFSCAYILPRLVGMAKALELMYTGDIIDAQEALRIGLVTQVVPQDGLMPAALALAERIAKGPPIALELTKRLAYQSWFAQLENHVRYEELYQSFCVESEDVQEGVRSFMEKREAEFKGR
jgi:2-(1,2-epoxy-1,2-dihydrophenyl)acetyl-CoA isomerase